jgi:outer membrane receptor protein involved in Fe transport
MRRLSFAGALVLALAAPALAQTGGLSGTIVEQTGAAVPGAAIVLTGSASGRSTISSGIGDFTFADLPAGMYRLTISLEGFSPIVAGDIAIGDRVVELPPIMLHVAPLSDTVIVSASRTEDTLGLAPATMSLVGTLAIETTPSSNLADLLRGVPGVNVIQMSARDVNLTSRHATSTLTNTELGLVDGRSIYQNFFGAVLWDFVPSNTSDIKQIEIVRGPASVVWGANAVDGVVNIVTKTPRESPGTIVTVGGGLFSHDAGSTVGQGPGALGNASVSVTRVPNARWAYRLSAGYFHSDALPRPAGQIPLIEDPRAPGATVGGASYPGDANGAPGAAFVNRGTSQPKFDIRVDQEISGGRVTYAGGFSGTSGIVHTALGPFDIDPGSFMGYGRVGYRKGGLTLNAFVNAVNASAPNLLLVDGGTGKPLHLDLKSQTYDVEAGDTRALGRHVLTFGANARHEAFDVTIAPAAKTRNELGAYLQDEFVFPRARIAVGARVDDFGNLPGAIVSPRAVLTYTPSPNHTFRLSYNRAFLAPSVIDNALDIRFFTPLDLSGLAPFVPAPLQSLLGNAFPLVVRAVGSDVPINGSPRPPLKEESLTAYELGYSVAIGTRTTVAASFYINDRERSIRFVPLSPAVDPYTPANPPPGWFLGSDTVALLAQLGVVLPRTAYSFANLGPVRDKGVEVSVEHRLRRALVISGSYSWQARPAIRPAADPFPATALGLPPTNRFNAGVDFDTARFLGSAGMNYADKAFWSDVLTSQYFGYSNHYTMVNGSFGMKWSQGRIITLIKGTNLLNEAIQQHVFGDVITRAATLEIRIKL